MEEAEPEDQGIVAVGIEVAVLPPEIWADSLAAFSQDQFSSVAQSCPTLCDPMDCSPPGSSVHGIFQARVLERGAIAFSIELQTFSPLL